MLYLWLAVGFLSLVCVWLHNRVTIAETRLQLLAQFLRAPHVAPGPIPTPQEQAGQEGQSQPFTPYHDFGSVWDNPMAWTPRHRPHLPKEDVAGNKRAEQEKMQQTRDAVPYGWRSGDEPRRVE